MDAPLSGSDDDTDDDDNDGDDNDGDDNDDDGGDGKKENPCLFLQCIQYVNTRWAQSCCGATKLS